MNKNRNQSLFLKLLMLSIGSTCSITSAQPILIPCEPRAGMPTGLPAENFVCLDQYSSLQDLVFRSIGQVNFSTDVESAFIPFIAGGPNPNSGMYINESFRTPYGDRLGYEASGLFDVDGDGFNDWSTAWYDAQPVDGLTNTPRVPLDAYIIPIVSALQGSQSHTQTAADLSTKADWKKVGMCRVFSGRDNTQIGHEIWSHKN